MSLAAAFLLGLAGALAVSAIWLVWLDRRKDQTALASLADHRGWDHRAHGPEDLQAFADRVWPKAHHKGYHFLDYLAGPSAVGPFRLCRVRTHNGEGRQSESTLVHIRTPLRSPGIHVAPRQHYRNTPEPIPTNEGDAGGRFPRLYAVKENDPEFSLRALDSNTRAFLLAPRRTIRMDWHDRDLVLAFPLAARTPHSVEALVSWSTALADRLNEAHHTERGRNAYAPAPQPAIHPTAGGTAQGH